MKKVLIIVGGLALIGGVVYFYSKNKKAEGKDTNATNPTTPTTTPTSTTSGTTTSTTSGASTSGASTAPPAPTSEVNSELAPLPVAYGQVEINLQKAQDIVRKSLKGKKWSDVLNSTLKTINAKVGKLGYTYKEGILTKI
jgi:FtsZ-interacting cell division protein ZipA